jgi:hypothetical protein
MLEEYEMGLSMQSVHCQEHSLSTISFNMDPTCITPSVTPKKPPLYMGQYLYAV